MSEKLFLRNVKGSQGERGSMPRHKWEGDALQFENPDGTWGERRHLIAGPQGERGVHFTPNVAVNGDLTWGNNGGLVNPASANIRGPQGARFTPNVDTNGNLSWSNNGGLANPATQNIRGPQGQLGSPLLVSNSHLIMGVSYLRPSIQEILNHCSSTRAPEINAANFTGILRLYAEVRAMPFSGITAMQENFDFVQLHINQGVIRAMHGSLNANYRALNMRVSPRLTSNVFIEAGESLTFLRVFAEIDLGRLM